MKKLVLVMIFVSIGCGKSNLPITPSKDLFSSWTATDTSGLDFSAGRLSTAFTMILTASNQQKCSCTATTLTGTQSSGTFTYSSCTFVASSGGADPGCNVLNIQGTYTNTAASLYLCVTNPGPTLCSTYR